MPVTVIQLDYDFWYELARADGEIEPDERPNLMTPLSRYIAGNMASAEDHIVGFCHAFLRADKRERLARLLSGKRRWKGVVELAHPDDINERFATPWAGDEPERLLHHLTKLGAGDDCYIISDAEALDDKSMKLADRRRGHMTAPCKPATQSKTTAQPSTANFAATPARARPSSLLDTRVIYCGDNLEQLAKLPDRCID